MEERVKSLENVEGNTDRNKQIIISSDFQT